jgi:hypothetical protein
VTTRSVLFSSLFFFPLLLGSAVPLRAEAADCRDARGEPIACAAPAPSPEPHPAEHTHRDDEVGYFNLAPFFDLADPSGVRFTPDNPHSVPDVERGSHLAGIAPGFDHGFAGLSFGLGLRPAPWLRLPELTLAFGYGDFEGMSVDLVGGRQSLTGSVHDCWLLRAQLAGGFELDLDPVRLFALAHIGVSGYFAQVDVAGSSIGALGSDTFSTASLEAGWTVGMEIELDPEIAYTLGYRHVHTVVEQNSFFFGLNVRFR